MVLGKVLSHYESQQNLNEKTLGDIGTTYSPKYPHVGQTWCKSQLFSKRSLQLHLYLQ